MENNIEIQNQINELTQKVDLLLQYVTEQRLKSEVIDDFIADAAIVGKDVFRSTVEELDKQGCDMDPEELKYLAFKLMKNLKNFSKMIELFESTVDLLHDVSPIINEVGVDVIKKMNTFEQKGYFDYLKQIMQLMSQMQKKFTVDDIKNLSSNTETVVSIFKKLTDKEFLNTVNHTATVLSTVKMDDSLDNKSYFKLMKEMNSPEVRKSFSFLLRIIKEINKPN